MCVPETCTTIIDATFVFIIFLRAITMLRLQIKCVFLIIISSVVRMMPTEYGFFVVYII